MADPTFFSTAADFRRWLASHAAAATELLVGFHKVGSGRPSITLPEISRLSAGLRPPTRCVMLGHDILVECRFDG